MASKKNKQKKGFWAGLDARGKMLFTLAMCALALLISVGVCFALVYFTPGSAGEAASSASSSEAAESLVTEKNYDKSENVIDTTQYSTTILEESEDAGQEYIDATLFLGDSNTARMYRLFDFCTYANACGSVGMSASALANYACVQFSGYSGYVTMPEAVALMQPRRVILTFGTNDLNPSLSTESFIENYEEGILAVQQAYPSVDIIVNSIPPLGQVHSNSNLTQSQVDAFNLALVEMCQKNDWKFLNTAETLKDSSGYAKSEYILSSDGIHLTEAGLEAMFDYIRTHSYITEDDRPTLTAIPTHTGDKDVSTYTAPVVATAAPSTETVTGDVSSEAAGEVTSNGEWVPDPTAAPTEAPTQTYTYWTEVIAPTCTEGGYTIYHCNEDSTKDYTSDYTNALGHDEAYNTSGVCGRCGTVNPNYAPPTAVPTEVPTAEPVPTEAPVEPTAEPEPVPVVTDPPAEEIPSADDTTNAAAAGTEGASDGA